MQSTRSRRVDCVEPENGSLGSRHSSSQQSSQEFLSSPSRGSSLTLSCLSKLTRAYISDVRGSLSWMKEDCGVKHCLNLTGGFLFSTEAVRNSRRNHRITDLLSSSDQNGDLTTGQSFAISIAEEASRPRIAVLRTQFYFVACSLRKRIHWQIAGYFYLDEISNVRKRECNKQMRILWILPVLRTCCITIWCYRIQRFLTDT